MPGEPSPPSRLAWGVGVVACVVVAHCLAGAVKYGGEQRSVALQDASSFFALPQGALSATAPCFQVPRESRSSQNSLAAWLCRRTAPCVA
jgi:hypothetical protein